MKPSPAVIAHAIFATAVLSTAFAVASTTHDHDHDHDHDHEHHDKITGPQLLGIEDINPEQMEQVWTETMQPSAGHEVLKRFEGTWNATSSMWFDPSAPPEVSEAKATNTLIYGGRFVQTAYEGSFRGNPFQGTAFMGFDNVRKQFQTIWLDSRTTAISPAVGMLDATGDVITMVARMDEPMTGEINKPYKQVFTFTGDDSYTMELIEILYGDEFTVLKIEYTRAN